MVAGSKSAFGVVIGLLAVAFATAAGTGRLDFNSVSPSSCPTNCVSLGYNVAWDERGEFESDFRFRCIDICLVADVGHSRSSGSISSKHRCLGRVQHVFRFRFGWFDTASRGQRGSYNLRLRTKRIQRYIQLVRFHSHHLGMRLLFRS